MPSFTLGLDLGPNSIGWAIVTEDEAGDPQGLEAMGVRAFQEMVDSKTKTPRNHKRRDARQARRQRGRRKMRREALRNHLIRGGLLPGDAGALRELFHEADPYEIRKRGLDEELAPHELGRAIFHLNQRRGFLSNRKVRDSGEKKKEDGVALREIGELKKEIAESGSRTLGEFLADSPQKRRRRTERRMYEEEFDALWRKQAEFRPDSLNDALRARVRKTLFHQRPLKIQKDLVGKCTFEPHRKRCPWCRPEAQWFRALQDVNHLEVKDPKTRQYRDLGEDEREAIKGLLRERKTITWRSVRRALGLHEGETFNIEDGGKKNLIGARTLIDVRKILTKETWEAMPEAERGAFFEDLFSILKEELLLKRLERRWGLSRVQANALLNTEFQPGYASLSLRAIRRITPHLERGLNYHDACQAAGYLREDQKEIEAGDALAPPPGLRNPIVQKAINETRRVVNAIVREYGKPARIRVELARDMKLSQKRKKVLDLQNRKNRDLADEARKLMAELGVSDNGGNRLRYRLWKEQKCVCPYTGRSIGARDVFSPEFEVDHVLPYSRTLDDSYMNRTLSLASANRAKGNKTPREWKEGDGEGFSRMLQRVAAMKEMPFSKRRRFEQKEIDTEDFISRQLNDARYISREVSQYLKALGAEVQVTTGQATAALRRSWRLDGILAVDSDLEKNRADHRHHAIDALVIALTSRKLFLCIARLSEEQREVLGRRRFPLPPPWAGFMQDAREKVLGEKVKPDDPFQPQQGDLPDDDRANRERRDLSRQPVVSPAPDGEERRGGIVVSHQPLGKIRGAFHEETAYGRIEHEGREAFVRRVPLESLTARQVEKIVDARVRELVRERMAAHGGNAREAFANKPLHLEHSRKGTGRTRIKTVRVAENFSPGSLVGLPREAPFKYYKYGNNHHVEIIENVKTGRRKGRVVTTMEAARRARRAGVPIVQRDHGPEWRFVMSLSINDMVKLKKPVNGCNLYRVQLISAIGQQQVITLRTHTAASLDDNATRIIASPNTLRGQKISVDPLGELDPGDLARAGVAEKTSVDPPGEPETAHDQENR